MAVIAERYRLDEVIGAGGTGTVWAGFDLQLSRAVAVKEVSLPDPAGDGEAAAFLERVMAEARAVALIDHPSVVKIYDIVSHGGKPWLVLQLVRGQSLARKLEAAGRLTIPQAVTVAQAVIEALAAAHARGIVHRDVKPGNVLLSEGGQVLLTDFSIAKVSGGPPVTADGEVAGTPGYLAPELASGGPSGPAADLFGLGALLFRAVEGHGPFDRDDPHAAMVASVTEPHPRPVHAGPLTSVIDGLLAKDPAERWTLQKTRDELRKIARDITVPRASMLVPPVRDDERAPGPVHQVSIRGSSSQQGSRRPRRPWPIGARVTVGLAVSITLTVVLALTLKPALSHEAGAGAKAAPAVSTGPSASSSQSASSSRSVPSSPVASSSPPVSPSPPVSASPATKTLSGNWAISGQNVDFVVTSTSLTTADNSSSSTPGPEPLILITAYVTFNPGSSSADMGYTSSMREPTLS
jgi:serine/threonine protein kinase